MNFLLLMPMKNSLTALVLGLFMWTTATAQDAVSAFTKELAAKSTAIESICCRFEQVRSMQLLKEDVRQEGDFYYLRPDRILLSFDNKDYICMTQTHFQLQTAGVKQRVKLQSNPMLRELNRILSAAMQGDVKSLSAGFIPTVRDEGDCFEVELRPAKGRMAARVQSITMHFERATMSLTLLRMAEPSGDATTYRFFRKRFNEKIDSQIFNRE